MNLSFREKNLYIDLIATLGIAAYYLINLAGFSSEKLADIHAVMDLLWDVVVLTIVVSIVSWVVLSTHDRKSSEAPLDERENLVELKATRYGYWTLQISISALVILYGLITSEQIPITDILPFATLHLIVISFVIAELVVAATQLWGLRREI